MRAWLVVVLAWLCLAASARAENRLAAYAAVLREKGLRRRAVAELTAPHPLTPQALETVTTRPLFETSSADHLVARWIASLR
jgi:hypothetical protein